MKNACLQNLNPLNATQKKFIIVIPINSFIYYCPVIVLHQKLLLLHLLKLSLTCLLYLEVFKAYPKDQNMPQQIGLSTVS